MRSIAPISSASKTMVAMHGAGLGWVWGTGFLVLAACHLLLATCCLPLATYYWLFVPCHLLLVTCYWLFSTSHLLLATFYWLLSTGYFYCYFLLATCYWLLSTGHLLLATCYWLLSTGAGLVGAHVVDLGTGGLLTLGGWWGEHVANLAMVKVNAMMGELKPYLAHQPGGVIDAVAFWRCGGQVARQT